MSHHATAHSQRRRQPWVAPLGPRSPEEEHRPATPLELFFDLVIVVAVAQAASGLHHALAEGHVAAGTLTYSMVRGWLSSSRRGSPWSGSGPLPPASSWCPLGRSAPLAVVGVLLTPFTGQPVLATGLLLAGLTAFKVVQSATR